MVPGKTKPVAVTAIGDYVVDLSALSNFFPHDIASALQHHTLNSFMALGYDKWLATRQILTSLFSNGEGANNGLRGDTDLQRAAMHRTEAVTMVLPAEIGDYTDFYASREHATNLGKMFRPDSAPLLENWLHLPVGYHGRASTIVVSGTALHRPHGQQKPVPTEPPVFGPSKLIDFELEMAAWIGPGNAMGTPISVAEARKQVFGFSLFNDWSARDIQKWEYVPLGPFLGKNFGSTIGPWIVSTFALEPFLVPGPPQDEPKPLSYLQDPTPGNYDIHLKVAIQPPNAQPQVISESNYKYMYWNVFQQLAHHTINGCSMRPGDVIASGTISGPTPGSYGSMLELCWQGTKPIQLVSGGERKMIADGDTVHLYGECIGQGYRIGFGPCSGKLLPATKL